MPYGPLTSYKVAENPNKPTNSKKTSRFTDEHKFIERRTDMKLGVAGVRVCGGLGEGGVYTHNVG